MQYILYLFECKARFFPETWGLNMSSPIKFVYEAPYQIAANQMALKQTMRSQTKACITKSQGLRPSKILGSVEW